MGKTVPFDSWVDRKRLRFSTRLCPVLDGDEVYEAILIVLGDEATGKLVTITEYNKFLLEDKLNKELNTRLGYAKFICMFLNYIFFDRGSINKSVESNYRSNLDNIINLTIEDGNLFLDDYKNGRAGNKGTKTRRSVEICVQKLTTFCHFLFLNKEMKYFKQKNFKIVEKIIMIRGQRTPINQYKNPFKVHYPPNGPGRTKMEYISFYALAEFMDLAFEFYPMIALAIAIQAFTGLRIGEVCNVTFFNTNIIYINNDTSLGLLSWSVDLTGKPQLRSDGVNVGEIKSHGIAMVHPNFADFFGLVWEEHKRYLNNVFKKRNKFGALFMNQRGDALTDDSYAGYFAILVSKLIERLSRSGNATAVEESKQILAVGLTPHTLRYFFTQYIASLEGANIFDVAMYRRDRTFQAAMTYIRNNPYLIDRRIKDIQNKSMKKLGLTEG